MMPDTCPSSEHPGLQRPVGGSGITDGSARIATGFACPVVLQANRPPRTHMRATPITVSLTRVRKVRAMRPGAQGQGTMLTPEPRPQSPRLSVKHRPAIWAAFLGAHQCHGPVVAAL